MTWELYLLLLTVSTFKTGCHWKKSIYNLCGTFKVPFITLDILTSFPHSHTQSAAMKLRQVRVGVEFVQGLPLIWKLTSSMDWMSSNFLTLLSHFTRSPSGTGFKHVHTFSGLPLIIPSPLYLGWSGDKGKHASIAFYHQEAHISILRKRTSGHF